MRYTLLLLGFITIISAGDCDVLILDKTGTITEGSRSAIRFIPLEIYSEIDVGQAALAASIHDTSHEGKSIVDLAEENKCIPPIIERMLTAKSIEFSAETKVSGIEFVPLKETKLTTEQIEEMESLNKCLPKDDKTGFVGHGSDKGKVYDMLIKLAQSGEQVKILKGSVDAMLKLSEGLVNEAEVKWKSQEISKNGETPW